MTVKDLTNYLKRAVEFKSSLDLKDTPYIKITEEEFENGKFEHSTITKMENEFGDNFHSGKANNIIIIPKVFNNVVSATHNSAKDNITKVPYGFVYVKATLRNDCSLINDQKEPWIAQDVIWPCQNNGFAFGVLSKFNSEDSQINVKNQKPYFNVQSNGFKKKEKSWKDFIKELKAWYKEVTAADWTDEKVRNILKDCDEEDRYGFFRANEIIVILDDAIDAKAGISRLYNNIAKKLKDKYEFPLYEKMLSGRKQEEGHPYNENDVNSMKLHMGVMNGEYPLADSQRESIHHLCHMQEVGEVLAVSGPPGTGKTTLLQSVVADLMVNNAKLQKDPPVILATSTNNQAVTNIIDSFGKVKTLQYMPDLEGRWVDNSIIKSFAAYMPSDNALKVLKNKGFDGKYICTNNQMGNAYAVIESEDCIEKSKKIFLDKASKFFGKQGLTLKDCSRYLSDKINEWNKLKKEIIDEAVKVFSSNDKNTLTFKYPWYISLISKLFPSIKKAYNHKTENIKIKDFQESLAKRIPAIEKVESNLSRIDSLKKVNECLDETIRYLSFWLAVHYFEAKWLDGTYKEDINDEVDTKMPEYEDVLKAIYKRMALLTPCIVMTFFRLPSNLSFGEKETSGFLYNFADLLIVDEAGQVSPEIALASFSLAKRAVVVGDEQQIPPVWNTVDEIDRQLAKAYHVIDNENDFINTLGKNKGNGINCSESSIMNVATKACEYSRFDNQGGLFLSEHRRCYNDIIELCNDDVYYAGRLDPKRGFFSEAISKLDEEIKKLQSIEDQEEISPEKKKKAKEIAEIKTAKIKLMRQLPVMGYLNIKGEMTNLGGSHYNKEEADEIANWVLNHQELIIKAYSEFDEGNNKVIKKSIGDLVGVISPFRIQANKIKSTFKRKGLKGISVGTIHTFQGAEYPIIILSTVYDKYHQNSFFDRSKSLVNVAVSRAKDFFLVFGNRDCLAPLNTGSPTSLLRKYVTSDINKTRES